MNTATAARGELIVLYQLVTRGWLATSTNFPVRNSKNVDAVAIKGARRLLISVKAFDSDKGGALGTPRDNLIVNIHEGERADFIVFTVFRQKDYDCYVVDPETVNRDLLDCHEKYWKRYGEKRCLTDAQVNDKIWSCKLTLSFSGRDTQNAFNKNFCEKWSQYRNEDGWKLLDG